MPVKSFRVRIFTSDHNEVEELKFGSHSRGVDYTPEMITQILTELVRQLKDKFPGNEFRVIKRHDQHFNIVNEPIHYA